MNTCEHCSTAYRPHSPNVQQRYCSRTCHNRARNNRANDRKMNMLATLKLERGCAGCGYREYACALHFDHLPGTEKLFDLARAAGQGYPAIHAEIAKCEVVCANCHAVRTQDRAERKHRSQEHVQLALCFPVSS